MSSPGPDRRRTLSSYFKRAALVLVGLGMVVSVGTAWRSYGQIRTARADHEEAGLGHAAAEARVLMEFPSRLRESSGVAVSQANPGIYWTHNDSGDGPVIYGVRPRDGAILEFNLRGAPARDWEDIELAPCPFTSQRACLFVGDIGDNFSRRSTVSILIVEEPEVAQQQAETPSQGPEDIPWRQITAQFEDGPRDAEALAVDSAGRLLVVSKGREGSHRVYSIGPEELVAEQLASPVILRSLGELPVTPVWFVGKVVTGGAFVAGELVVRTYTEVYFHRLEEGTWIESRPPCFVGHLGPGGEGVDIGRDGRVYLTREGQGRRPAALDEVDCGTRAKSSGQVVSSSSHVSTSDNRAAASG